MRISSRNASADLPHFNSLTCFACIVQAELNDEIEEMERAKETKSGRPKSASNASSDDSDDDEGSTGGLSARAGSAMARPNAGGGGVSYEEFNV